MLRESTTPTEPVARRRTRNGNGRTHIAWPFVIGVVLVAALVVFVAQNSQHVEFQWLWVHFDASLAVMLLVTALVASGVTALAGLVWRTRQRHAAKARRAAGVQERTARGTAHGTAHRGATAPES